MAWRASLVALVVYPGQSTRLELYEAALALVEMARISFVVLVAWPRIHEGQTMILCHFDDVSSGSVSSGARAVVENTAFDGGLVVEQSASGGGSLMGTMDWMIGSIACHVLHCDWNMGRSRMLCTLEAVKEHGGMAIDSGMLLRSNHCCSDPIFRQLSQ